MPRHRTYGPQPYPDYVWLQSGGVDSTAAYLFSREAAHENFGKRPLMVYLDTRVGIPFQRLYVEQLADAYDEQLWTLRTHEKFEDRIAKRGKYEDRDDAGPPGGAQHPNVQNELKGRQREMMASRFPNLIYITGIRAGESDEREGYPKTERKRDIRYVKPVYELSKKECARIILQHEDCPINPAWIWNHFTDCGCLANGEPGELDAVQDRFPVFAQRLREYEEAAQKAIENEVKSILGWDGLTAEERRAKEQGQQQLSLCRGGCQRRVDPPVKQAFKAVVHGHSRETGLEILDGRLKFDNETQQVITV